MTFFHAVILVFGRANLADEPGVLADEPGASIAIGRRVKAERYAAHQEVRPTEIRCLLHSAKVLRIS